MKYVFLDGVIAREIIPAIDPVFPGIAIKDRYAPSFLARCVEVTDATVVEQNWEYDPVTKLFSVPPPPAPIEPSKAEKAP